MLHFFLFAKYRNYSFFQETLLMRILQRDTSSISHLSSIPISLTRCTRLGLSWSHTKISVLCYRRGYPWPTIIRDLLLWQEAVWVQLSLEWSPYLFYFRLSLEPWLWDIEGCRGASPDLQTPIMTLGLMRLLSMTITVWKMIYREFKVFQMMNHWW